MHLLFRVILWEIATRRRPWKGIKREVIISAILSGQRAEVLPEDNWNVEFTNLVDRCWHKNPANRPEFKVIIEDLKGIEIPRHQITR
jgi:hypothetical protein